MSTFLEDIIEKVINRIIALEKRLDGLEVSEYNRFNKTYMTDGITAPATDANWGQIYIDTADGHLTIKYGDGTTAELDQQDTNTTYTAGDGLTLTGTDFDVDFAGTGTALSASHSDHTHSAYVYTAGDGITLTGQDFDVDFAGTGSALSASHSDHTHSAYVYTAGDGLTLTGQDFDVDFAGTGSALSAAHSDHTHTGYSHPDIGARVWKSSNTSIATGTDTPIPFNSERYDTDSIHSTSSNTTRLTCKTAGKYIITGSVKWAANATGLRQLYINYNGGTRIAATLTIASSATVGEQQNVATIYDLAVNDYVELGVRQASGGDLNVLADANWSPEFMMHLLEG